MVVCLEQGANDLHIVQLMPLPPHHLLLHRNPVPAYPGCPGNEAVKRVSIIVISNYSDAVSKTLQAHFT